jgi:hypothetical protein
LFGPSKTTVRKMAFHQVESLKWKEVISTQRW